MSTSLEETHASEPGSDPVIARSRANAAPTSPWAYGCFGSFWAARTVSQLGSSFSAVLLPLFVLVTLGAGPLQVSWLRVATFVPYVLFALPAGVLADRRNRKSLMIAADLVRAGALLAIPIGAILGWLSFVLVLLITLIASCFTVIFDVAATAILPQLVDHTAISGANTALQLSESAAELAGPAAAGVALAACGPVAIVADAASYLFSAWRLRTVDVAGERGTARRERPVPCHGLFAGVRIVWRSPVLRPLALYLGVANIAAEAFITVSFIFLLRVEHLGASVVGLVLSIGSTGLIFGAVASGRLATRIGVGRTLVVATFADALGLCVVGASPARDVGIASVCMGLAAIGAGNTLWNVQSVSLRQSVTAPADLGKVNAAVRAIAMGTVPIGALLGGIVASSTGTRPVVLGCAALSALAATLVISNPAVRAIKTMPRAPTGNPATAD